MISDRTVTCAVMKSKSSPRLSRRKPTHEAERRADAQRRADGAGDEVVGHAFGDEGLDQVAALRADRAGHAHLGLPLGGEHHEDHEDQHDAGGDREEAEDEEEGREHVADLLGLFDGVLLDRLDLDGAVAEAEQRLALGALDERLEARRGRVGPAELLRTSPFSATLM